MPVHPEASYIIRFGMQLMTLKDTFVGVGPAYLESDRYEYPGGGLPLSYTKEARDLEDIIPCDLQPE